MKRLSTRIGYGAIAAVMIIVNLASGGPAPAGPRPIIAVVVQNGDAAATAVAVRAAGGTVRRTLDIIGGVAADVTPAGLEALRRQGLAVTPDSRVGLAAAVSPPGQPMCSSPPSTPGRAGTRRPETASESPWWTPAWPTYPTSTAGSSGVRT